MFTYAQLKDAYDLTAAAWRRNMAEWKILLERNAPTGLLTPWAVCRNRSERYLGGMAVLSAMLEAHEDSRAA